MGAILPPEVAWDESYGDLEDAELFAAERAAIARAVGQRRREFATVRHCARRALATLGHPAVAVVPGRRGAPLWPTGVVGSMTHCSGYRAAAVSWRRDVRGIGIDAEPDLPLPTSVLPLLVRPDEAQHLAELARTDGGPNDWARLLFTCKESIFKAWYPITGRELDFTQVTVRLAPEARSFEGRMLVDRRPWTGIVPARLTGRWTVQRALVASAVVLTA